jgi:hypothetical protein
MTHGDDSILLVGLAGANQESIAHLLMQRDWNWKAAESLASAVRHLGRMTGLKLVLAAEVLVDGRGYELTDLIARQGSSLLVGVMLSEGEVWLPVVERGERTFGRGGIGMADLGSVVSELLDDRIPSSLWPGRSPMKAAANQQIAGVDHRIVAAH